MTEGAWLFWLLAALMTLVAVWAAVLPWMSRRSCVVSDQMAIDYPQLTSAQREQEKHELMRELLEDVSAANEPLAVAPPAHRERWPLPVIAITLPILAGALYVLLGSGIYLPFTLGKTAARDEGPSTQAIEQMAAQIAERLAADPKDQRGWEMLGRTEMALARYPDAVAAYAHALALVTGNHKNEELNAAYADALWMAGLSAFQTEHYQDAAAFWKQIIPLLPEDAGLLAKITGAITEAEQRAARHPK